MSSISNLDKLVSLQVDKTKKTEPFNFINLIVDNEKAVELDLICPICADLCNDPVELLCCGNLFCESCITTAHKTKNTCPMCRNPFSIKDIGVSKYASRNINKIRVKCMHVELGCTWVGNTKTRKQHLSDECKYSRFTCCDLTMNRVDWNVHNNEHIRANLEKMSANYELYEESLATWNIRLAIHYFSYEINAKAIEILSDLCQKRNSHALTLMAHCYAKGLGTAIDEKNAFDHYTLAARQGNARAMYYLASAYAGGKGCDQNWGNSIDLLLESAKLGDSFAQYSLGMMFELGQVFGKNPNIALTYFSAAAKQGHAAALQKLSAYYTNGVGELSKIPLIERTKKAAEFAHDAKLRMDFAKSRLSPKAAIRINN